MLEQLPAPAWTVSIRTLREDRVLLLDRLGVAHRAAPGWTRRPRPIRALGHVWCRREDLGDDVACPQDDHLLPLPDVLAPQVLLVVEGRELYGHPPDDDRLEHPVGMEVAELAGVPADLLERGDGGGGREFPGDRPAGLPTHDAQAALELHLVELDHHSVDLEVE